MDTTPFGANQPFARFAGAIFDAMTPPERDQLAPLLARLAARNVPIEAQMSQAPALVRGAVNRLFAYALTRCKADAWMRPQLEAAESSAEVDAAIALARMFWHGLQRFDERRTSDPFGAVAELMAEVAAGPPAQRADALAWALAQLDAMLEAAGPAPGSEAGTT